MVEPRCVRVQVGASTTSSPDNARLAGMDTGGLSRPVRFECTLFLGWKSSRKSEVKSLDKRALFAVLRRRPARIHNGLV
jgi:hypothetical protein